MRVETQYDAIRLNVPEWYERADFVTWLNQPGTATWHTPGAGPGEYSDAFLTWDNGEGSDSPDGGGLPDDIWAEITRVCREHRGGPYIVWLTNIE